MNNEENENDPVPIFEVKDGQVFVDGEVVAKHEGNELKIKRGFAKHREAIEQVLDAEGESEAQSPEPVPPATPPATPPAVVEARPEGVIDEARVESRRYQEDVEDDLAFTRRKGIAPPPKKNPQFGDKTPAYVEWLKEHRPEKYRAKFGIEREAEKVPVSDDEGNVLRHETKDIGRRKTHLGEKIERDPALDESMDWNA